MNDAIVRGGGAIDARFPLVWKTRNAIHAYPLQHAAYVTPISCETAPAVFKGKNVNSAVSRYLNAAA